MPEYTRNQKPKQQPRNANSPANRPAKPVPGQALRATPHLRHAIGNQSVAQFLKPNPEAPNASSNTAESALFALDLNRISIFSPTAVRLQPKLRINTAGDRYEQEADRVAEEVMRMPDPFVYPPAMKKPPLQTRPLASTIMPLVQRQSEPEEEEELEPIPTGDADVSGELHESIPTADADALGELHESVPPTISIPTLDKDEQGANDEGTYAEQETGQEEEEELLQPKTSGGAKPTIEPGIAQNINSLKGSGQPLPASERAFFEPRFGIDFSKVRVHSNSRAATSANSINARAFTLGRDLVFAAGQYAPGTSSSRRLMAHELTHVIQQQGVAAGNRSLDPSRQSKTDQMASRVIEERSINTGLGQAPLALQRQRATPGRASRSVSRAVAQQTIEAYLQRASAAQSKGLLRRTLKVTATIRTDLSSLFIGDLRRMSRLDSLLLTQTHLHGDPALLARHVAKLLPPRMDRKKLAYLTRTSGTQKQTRLQSLKKVLKPKPRQASPLQRAQPVKEASSLERYESGNKQLRKFQKLRKITTYGPVAVDPVARIRQIRKLITKPFRPIKPARKFSAVEKTLGQFGSNALVPGEVLIVIQQARETWEMAGPDDEPRRLRELKAARARTLDYASPRRVARYLARSMVAGKRSIPLMLDNIYNSVRQRKAIYSELERIIRTVHKRLGRSAAGVEAVDVYFGNKLVRRIRLVP